MNIACAAQGSPEARHFEVDALGECLSAAGMIGAGNADKLLEFLQAVDFKGFFDQFSHAEIVKRLLEGAYWHPSGFVRTRLFSSSRDRPEIRLHYWQRHADGSVFDEAIHEHPWDSISIVLDGRIANEFWALQEGSDLPITYFETADMASAKYSPLGNCSARQSSTFEVAPGQFYWIPSGVFHRTRLVSDSAITLFVRGPFLRLFSLMAARGGPAMYSATPKGIDPALVFRMVAALRRATARDGLKSVRMAPRP